MTLSTLTRKCLFLYSEMLEYFKELRSGYPEVYNSEFIPWNNKEITIECNSIICLRKGFFFVQDLLSKDGKFLSLENMQRKYNVQLNYVKYFQLIAAIPNYLKLEKSASNCCDKQTYI